MTSQEANKKELTLKFPGATADLIATKNLFDVYLKTRVLDICGDAADKENAPRWLFMILILIMTNIIYKIS